MTVNKSNRYIYLDHAATTPVDPLVVKAMSPFWSKNFGNPSSLYRLGKEAEQILDQARATIAKLINARSTEIIFTAGGTESINLAVFGVARKFLKNHNAAARFSPHIITTAIEHHAVLNSCRALEGEGCKVTYLPVDEQGFIKLEDLKKAIRPETVLVSVMYANNEIGTIEPLPEIAKIIRKANLSRSAGEPKILFHTDACQAAGSLEMDVQKLGADLLSANGSKLYGPKQTGFLFVRSGVILEPVLYGGGQEQDLRSGTENVAGVVGLAKAFELSQKHRTKENKRQQNIRDYFLGRLLKEIPDTVLNGPDERNKKLIRDCQLQRLPNNINVSFLGVDGEALVLYLDAHGVAASTGSACTSGNTEPSHVIAAIGRGKNFIQGSMRFTLGKETTKKQVDSVIKVLVRLVSQLRKVEEVSR